MRYGLACISVVTIAVLACGPEVGDEPAAGPGGSDTGTTGVGGSDTADGTGEGGSDSSSGSEGGTGPGETTCPDPDDSVEIAFSLDPDPGLEGFTATCTVGALTREGNGTRVELSCTDEVGMERSHVLAWEANPGADVLLHEGTEVELEWVVEPVFWINRWFALRHGSDGRLIAAGALGSSLNPPAESINAFLGGPEVDLVEGACDPEPDDCGPVERVGLDLVYDDVTVRVFDHQSGSAGQLDAYRLTLQAAEHQEDAGVCSDLPGRWYQFLILAEPEG